MTDQSVERQLLENIKQQLPELERLRERASSHWEYEDYVYRFYHHSFKVVGVQSMTLQIVETLLSRAIHAENDRQVRT